MYKKGNKSEKKKTRGESYSVLKKNTKKLNFQPAQQQKNKINKNNSEINKTKKKKICKK